MAPRIKWKCQQPADDLSDAMVRIALQIASDGEYNSVEILSTPKTTTGGRSAAPHFKVMLIGTDGERTVQHPHLIKIVHRDARGHEGRYQMKDRPRNYNYLTLVAKNRPPSHCPKNRRLQRDNNGLANEVGDAANEQSSYGNPSSYEGSYGEGSSSGGATSNAASSSTTDYGSNTQSTGNAQSWPDGWYADPWANASGASSRWFENGVWTGRTK